MRRYGYSFDSPWDVLTTRCSAPLSTGDVTVSALLFALRALGRATPIQVAAELGVDSAYPAHNLSTMYRAGTLDRIKTLASKEGQNRSTYIYWIKNEN